VTGITISCTYGSDIANKKCIQDFDKEAFKEWLLSKSESEENMKVNNRKMISEDG